MIAVIAGFGLSVYAAVGCIVGLAFVAVGVTAVQAAPVTLGARLLLLPAAVALWPFVLLRWRRGRS